MYLVYHIWHQPASGAILDAMRDTVMQLMATMAALPGFDLVGLIQWGGFILVALIIFAESGLLIGFFLPGDSLLFTAGFLVYTDLLPINIVLFIVILFVAAVLGDSVGYTFGRRVGRKLFDKPSSRVFKQEYVVAAEKFYHRHGGKAIILARFVPVVRTFAPIVAGTAKMPYRRFLAFNVIGGFVWTAGITSLGYFLGHWFTSAGIEIDTIILPIVATIIFLSILPPLIHIFKDKKRRDAVWDTSKRQFISLRGKITKKRR